MNQGSRGSFDCGTWTISGGDTQSDLAARSGKYSSRLDENHRYGFGVTDESAKPGDVYRVSVWTSGKDGRLVVTDKASSSFYHQTSMSRSDSAGWRKLSLVVHVPPYVDQQSLCAYVWNPGGETVYFDDFKLVKGKSESESTDIRLDISDKVLTELCAYRDSAKVRRQITSDLKVWLPITFSTNEFTCDAQLRLKGDWVDHVLGAKWSFRIKLEPGRLYNGMSQFSVQAPEVRDYLAEWVYHKACETEDVMTTQYDFALLELNGMPMGCYAVEEHFTMDMAIRLGRTRGPILKLEEDLMFWYLKNGPGKKLPSTLPWIRHAGIKPFGSGALAKNPKLKRDFERAQDMLHAFRNFDEPAIGLFKTKKLVAASILTDMFRAHHALRWHNQRFYYDPKADRLEPVMYDAFGSGGEFDKKRHVLGVSPPRVLKDLKRLEQDPMDLFGTHIHLDPTALAIYKSELNRICDSTYVADFYASIADEFKSKSELLRVEYPEYSYDTNRMWTVSQAMRKSYGSLEWGQRLSVDSLHQLVRFEAEVATHEHDLIMVQVFFAADSLVVVNYSEFPVSVIRVNNKGKVQATFKEVVVPAFEFNKEAPQIKVAISGKVETVHLKMRDAEQDIAIKPWREPRSNWRD